MDFRTHEKLWKLEEIRYSGVAMPRRKDDFTYSPGILAKKMGVHVSTVKKHLKDTGLIKQCYKDDNNWLRIPQSVALKFVAAETLAIPLKHKRKKGRKAAVEPSDDKFQDELIDLGLAPHIEAEKLRRRTPPPKALTPAQEERARIAEVFKAVGITTKDVLAFIESQKAQKEGNQNVEKETTE